jgi:hypothetical protein
MNNEIENEVKILRSLDVIFIKEFKFFIKTFVKKNKEDYLLNVNKIIKDKFGTKFLVPNPVQSFLLNYEIKKLMDKAINIKNEKYIKIIYLNSNITTTGIYNTMEFLKSEYPTILFNYYIIDPKEDFEKDLFSHIEINAKHILDKIAETKIISERILSNLVKAKPILVGSTSSIF